jgi:Na+/melibiose symporter-like transporter
MGESGTPRLSRLVKFFYGAGDTGFSITYTTMDFLFAKFLLDFAAFYPLSREQHARIRRLLERKRLRAGVTSLMELT